MSNDDVETLIDKEAVPSQPAVEEVLEAQREEAATGLVSQTGPLDLVGPDNGATADAEPALAPLINNTGDDGGPGSA